MRYGQTSMVTFLSKLVMSFSGFVATIVLTRTLGQEQYGTYVIVLSVLSWVAIGGNLGIRSAVRKRISEGTKGNYIIPGVVTQLGLYALVALLLWIVHPYLNSYMETDATFVLILLLAARLFKDFIRTVLDGQHLVHISSILEPVEWISRSVIQVSLVLFGFGIGGAFVGYFFGAVMGGIIGLYFVSVNWSLPSRREFNRLKSFAQFSWFGQIKGRTFLSMDTIILAIFVSNSLIAVYEIAWNLASVFTLFGSSITKTLFPEMSNISSNDNTNDELTRLLNIGLEYMGLFTIPGLVGSVLVGDVILTIYGSGFETGYHILIVLIFSRLVYAYKGQFNATLDAMDRPDITFRIDLVFVGVNLGLNLVLTWRYGWYGAAAATTSSAVVGCILGYYYTNQLINVTIPKYTLIRQIIAAGVMALTVYVNRLLFGDSLPVILILVGIGAVVYFVVLLTIWRDFRLTVRDNLPFDIP